METKNVILTELVEVVSMLPDFFYDYDDLKAKIVKKCRKITRRGNSFKLIKEIDKNAFIIDEFYLKTDEMVDTNIYWSYDYKYDVILGNLPVPVSKNHKLNVTINELNDLKQLIVKKLVDSKVVPFIDDDSELKTGDSIKDIFEEFFAVKLE